MIISLIFNHISSIHYLTVSKMSEARLRRMKYIWAALLCISFPIAIILPFLNLYVFHRISFETNVSLESINSLLFTSSILFGFTSLIVVSKEWVDRRVWSVLLPPLILLVLSGVSISNLAVGTENPVSALLLGSATFNANVVSTGFLIGYIMQMPRNSTNPNKG